eukprot:CAMPEP_0170566374 /NCGR_PEP_ID=MMETSP0211-20121228/79795_1 /TAXON_ID=311385 /ORGANISM="Pseudokeronopsis sp., Strain OXSARD2" /LENGTH=83 /DNA_ID=CAMNT_0010887527 /DNA_START=2006 /DNA_END=2254 /DNA_ORIENTATION=-
MNNHSIPTNDVLFKKGVEIEGRFFIVTVGSDETHLIIDAFEEKPQKRLELRITSKGYLGMKEIEEIVDNLGIKKLSGSERSGP